MTKSPFIWTGRNLTDVAGFLGNENFWHKAGILIIKNNSNIAYTRKVDSIDFNSSGDVINKIQPNDLDRSIVKAIKKLIR